MSDDSIVRHRIRTELTEIAKLLYAAEQMADGLVDVLTHVYDLDGRTKNALAAANHLGVVLSEEYRAADDRASDAR